MRLPRARGPVSAQVVDCLRATTPVPGSFADVVLPDLHEVTHDEDLQLALWILYEQSYRGFDDATDHEWDPDAVALRRRLEDAFETELRAATVGHVMEALSVSDELVAQVEHVIAAVDGPNVAGYLQRQATREQVVEFLVERSVYHLKESDPHSFVLARVDGATKVALAELQYDEYGAGRPDRLHAALFADALVGAGLDPTYGAYVDRAPGSTLAVNNVMSLFTLQRRLRGAALGHLAAFEATSSMPCRRIAAGIDRVGLPPVVSAYFEEHVEADAAHEQVAVRDVCGSLVTEHPELREDVLFGVAACLHLDAVAGRDLFDRWGADREAVAS